MKLTVAPSPRKVIFSCGIAAALMLNAQSSMAQSVFDGTNLALSGDAIMGVHDGVDLSTLGTPYNQNDNEFNAGAPSTPTNLNDGDQGTYETTAKAQPDADFDYVGIIWGTTQNNVAGFRAYFDTFTDGGGFETSPLPVIQTTTDGGTVWSTVSNQSFYNSEDNYDVVGFDNSGLASFLFDPVSGINGIRLIGDGNGSLVGNGSRTGFIGLSEIEVYSSVPEPASTGLAILAFTGLYLFQVRSRRRKN